MTEISVCVCVRVCQTEMRWKTQYMLPAATVCMASEHVCDRCRCSVVIFGTFQRFWMAVCSAVLASGPVNWTPSIFLISWR